MKVKVGAVSPSCKGDRFQVMKEYIESKDLDLICFPEEYLGFDFNKWKPTYVSKEEVVTKVSELARKNDVHIVTGFLELIKKRPREKFFNKALLFSPKGLVGTYIKTNPTQGEIEHGQVPGNKVDVFETEIGKIAMLICYEVWFPELSRIAALKGAEIICFPTGIDIGKEDKTWQTLWWARAIENNAYVVQCINAKNSVISVICGPEKILACSEKEGMITAELDLDRLRKIREGKVETEIEPALLKRRNAFLRKIGKKMLEPQLF